MTHITDKLVRGFKPPQDKLQDRIVDDELTGFGIRVTKGGAKTFFLNYTVGGRERRTSIGRYPAWSVAAAREKAKELRRMIDSGVDPQERRDWEDAAPTLASLWLRYSEDILVRKAPKTKLDQVSIWKRLVAPELGTRKVASITYTDIERLHIKVSRCTRVQANRMLALIRNVFACAIRWGYIAENPAKGVKQNNESPRERILTAAERQRFEQAVTEHDTTCARLAIEMLYLTGARKSEVLTATWDQFDLDSGVWTKPSAHTKQRKIHVVPLNRASLDVLARAKTLSGGQYAFSRSCSRPMNDVRATFKKLCQTARIEGFRIHDLRHCFASVLAARGADIVTIGKLMGHTQLATTLRYSHLQHDTLRIAAELASSD